MDVLNYRDILVKKPWYEYLPDGYMAHGVDAATFDKDTTPEPDDSLYRRIKTQGDFLREYFPSSHNIFDPYKYPDIWKWGPANPEKADDPSDPLYGKKKLYRQPIQRTAFAFQQLIAVKHILHLTGNDVQFEVANDDESDDELEKLHKLLTRFKKGWLMADMEIRFYEAVRSLMITADAAVVGYFDDKKKFAAKTLSYLNGDKLYPQFDSLTGKLVVFARKYYDYDDDGDAKTEWVEVWDETTFYRYKKSLSGNDDTLLTRFKKLFGFSGYTLVDHKPHGFPSIPVAYVRNDEGPCWHAVQRNIEDYEQAFSYLCENNKAYAFPIFFIKGDGDDVQIQGDMNGSVKAIAMNDTSSDAGFLDGTDASDAFATQLQKSYDLIYELSFTVKPPELKSGDLPGVALKLLYSPALEIAMNDAQHMQPFLSQLVEIVKYGIGFEDDKVTDMVNLPLNAWIEPYIHQNKTEVITNLATAVQNGFLSHQTASERTPDFPVSNEYDRIIREEKEKQQQDLLQDIALQDAQTENNIQEEEAQARINKGQSGQDVNTNKHGNRRGRPNKFNTDKWGNRIGEEHWTEFNRFH